VWLFLAFPDLDFGAASVLCLVLDMSGSGGLGGAPGTITPKPLVHTLEFLIFGVSGFR